MNKVKSMCFSVLFISVLVVSCDVSDKAQTPYFNEEPFAYERIRVNMGDVFIQGSKSTSSGTKIISIISNDAKVWGIEGDVRIVDFAVDNGNIYVIGSKDDDEGYWINDDFHPLGKCIEISTSKLLIHQSQLYISGTKWLEYSNRNLRMTYIPFYFIDGDRRYDLTSDESSCITDMNVINGRVILTGYTYHFPTKAEYEATDDHVATRSPYGLNWTVPYYWIDGKQVKLAANVIDYTIIPMKIIVTDDIFFYSRNVQAS